jgi:methyl-accepting chemotaxis protein
MNSKFNNSIKFKLSLAVGIVISSILIAFITLVSIKTREEAIESAERTAITESHECAKHIQLELSKTIIANRMLCQTFNSVKDKHPEELSRDAVNTILKNTLETFPDLFGAFTVWEPNAFDNNDVKYSDSDVSKAGHDTTGRLIPLWYRSIGGDIKLVPIQDYENEQSSAWYYMPQKSGIETIMDPFYYKNVYLISVVNPIIKDGRFLGVTGLGMRISFVQKMLDELDVYNKKGEITILSDAGTIVASSKSTKLAGKPIQGNYKIPSSIFTDQQEVVSIHHDTLQAFVPFKLGNSEKTWVAMVQIPSNELMASANNLILLLFVFGLTAIVLIITGIYFYAGKLTQPLLTLITMAEKLAIGNIPDKEDLHSNSVEVEKLSDSLDKIAKSQIEITSVCKAISENDFNTKVLVRSPEDKLSASVNKMIDSLQATSIEDKNSISKTAELLEQAKNQTEILKANENVLRQNLEQIKAKQEELIRTHEEETSKKIEELKANQAEIMIANEKEMHKKMKELEFNKLELQAEKTEMNRKEQNYVAEIQKLKLGAQKEILVKKSAFSKFVIPVEVKK